MINRFSRQPTTRQEWKSRAKELLTELDRFTPEELLRGGSSKRGQTSDGGGDGYDPRQPRVPAGHPDGGQWTDRTSGSAERINDPRILSDVTPDNLWIPGADYVLGHHWFAKRFYQRMAFSRDVKRVFRDSTSGPLADQLWSRRRQTWLKHRNDWPHREYDAAVKELVLNYMSDRGITPSQMRPAQAYEVVELIKKSSDPRIQSYVKMINTLHRFFRMYGGRGNE